MGWVDITSTNLSQLGQNIRAVMLTAREESCPQPLYAMITFKFETKIDKTSVPLRTLYDRVTAKASVGCERQFVASFLTLLPIVDMPKTTVTIHRVQLVYPEPPDPSSTDIRAAEECEEVDVSVLAPGSLWQLSAFCLGPSSPVTSFSLGHMPIEIINQSAAKAR